MQIPKYIVFRVDVMRKGTSVELTNITDDVEDVILKAEQTEPQTCSFSDCDNFKNPDYARCIECKRKQIECKRKQIEPKTEPQTKYPCDTCANNGDHDGECRNCVSDSEVIRWKRPSHYKPKDEPYIDIETGILHWCGWKYKRIYEDEPQTDCAWKKGEEE